MSTSRSKDGELQVAAVSDKAKQAALPPRPLVPKLESTALVEYTGPVFKEEEEDLEIKLRRIIENVPVRVSNTSGSSAGSGSGDFHQVFYVDPPLIRSARQYVPWLYPGGYFDPLGLASDPENKKNLQLAEIKHGRLAMLAFLIFCLQAVLTGKGPVSFLATFSN